MINQSCNDATNLDNSAYYNNRELSWLSFNKRVLEEAIDIQNPLLERLKFLAIFSSNLDEFFMVRVAGLKDQVKVGFNKPENKSGLTPKEQLEKISRISHQLVERQYDLYNSQLLPLLEKEEIILLKISELSSLQKAFIETYFMEQIFPVLTPMAVDAYQPFPFVLNKSINLAVVIKDVQNDLNKFAIVQVPSVLDRFIQIPDSSKKIFILLEDIIIYFIYHLFTGYKVTSLMKFRITRNADLTIHEEGARDLLKEIEEELKKRKWGAAVRLEVENTTCDADILTYLIKELEIHEKDIYLINGPLDLTFLNDFYNELSYFKESLIYQSLIPQLPRDLSSHDDIFTKAIEEDLLFHHPYESFEPIINLIREAAKDPDVLAIKQTLYRVGGDSPVIQALKYAAENGKQVTVLVELRARFDEENNVQWAKELDKSGCHVIYGKTNLKIHSKITLIVRRKHDKIERFVHLGTGNYNDVTSKLYTDFSFITSKQAFGIDATNFFNYLSGHTIKPDFNHITIAPFDLRQKLINLIEKEIKYHLEYQNGRIIAKINALTDKAIMMKLYEASKVGVKIDLIVRGICCIRPKMKGISENISVRSILSRFLEHSRIYYFHHNNEELIYLSSADMMTRNMEKRVEIMFPILNEQLKGKLKTILAIFLADNVKAREQNANGEYTYVERHENDQEVQAQLEFYKMYEHILEDEE